MIPGDAAYRAEQRADLLRFAAGSRHDDGFGYLDDRGHLDSTKPVELYVTCRMTHVFSLGLLAGEEPAASGPSAEDLRALVEHGVEALLHGPLRDQEFGGWLASVHDGAPVNSAKEAYGHAFVVLAASSALAAGAKGAGKLLDVALEVQDARFWDGSQGLVVEEWDRAWERLDTYRGLNSNMHTVEAYLAAGDVACDDRWHVRAGQIAARVADWARKNQWRIPEHFTADWEPVLDYNRDHPAHPFRPYGATIGHGLEWARLLIAVGETLGDRRPADLVGAAIALTERAISDGWAVDGADGFVYTTDWEGSPVVHARMHWVLAEAIGTATVLHRTTGERRHARDLDRWWAYADKYLVDHGDGSWYHELDETNAPSAKTWPGKPDAYHAYQAALIGEVPTVPSFASALARGKPGN